MIEQLQKPEKLVDYHELDAFDCGNEVLNSWLKYKAAKNEKHDASRTYVVCHQKRVMAYYSLAVGAIDHIEAVSRFKRNMPNPTPIMLLARLAIDQSCQGMGLGTLLIRDALIRTLRAAEIGGIKGVVVHAIDDDAKCFYLHHGFKPSPTKDMTLMVSIKEVKAEVFE